MGKQLKELVSYGLFGGITTAVNLILFYCFSEIGVQYILANTISYFMAVALNYVLNMLFVFANAERKGKRQWLQFMKFVIVRLLSLAVDNCLFYIAVSVCEFPLYLSRIVLSTLIIVLTFIFNKFFVFNR